jgi:hypothetical protein
MQLEVNFAGILTQGNEEPLARKMLKGPVHKGHVDLSGSGIGIARMKKLLNAFKFDLNFGIQTGLGLLKNLHPATPRQKLGVAGNVRHEVIHTISRLAN